MAIEDLMADIFNQIIEGNTLNESVGEWNISNLNSPLLVEMYRPDAIYGFESGAQDDFVYFNNYHREARKGTGTKSLKQLEAAFDVLAKKRKQKVVVLFDTFKQEDTGAWLTKKGYILDDLNGRKIYQKIFDPNS